MIPVGLFAEDDVFYPDEAGRFEYVMNPTGVIYQGSADSVGERSWIYGQVQVTQIS